MDNIKQLKGNISNTALITADKFYLRNKNSTYKKSKNCNYDTKSLKTDNLNFLLGGNNKLCQTNRLTVKVLL